MHRRLLGLVGSAMLAVTAVHGPINQIPFVGSAPYSTLDHRRAMVMLGLGLLGAIGSVLRAVRFVLSVTAFIVLAALVLRYGSLH